MGTLEPIIQRAIRTALSAVRLGLASLPTFSGLAIVLGLGFVVITGQPGVGGESNDETEAAPTSRLIAANETWTPMVIVFYLVESEAQTHLAAAEEYEAWAGPSGLGVEGWSMRVSYLLARTAAEEATAYALIVQEIGRARTPSVVTIIDKRARPN